MLSEMVEIGGDVFELKYKYLLPPLAPEQRQGLKEDIESRGLVTPVIVSSREDGSYIVLDGSNRIEIAFELRLKVLPITLRRCKDEEEERKLAIALNLHRRHMTREQRAEWVAKLRAEGKSTGQIAKTLGVPQSTVVDDLKQPVKPHVQHTESGKLHVPEKITGKDGKERPAEKPSIDELSERRAKAAALKETGKTRKEIADDLGVSVRTVASDLSEAAKAVEEEASETTPVVPYENSWARVMESHIYKWGHQLAMFRKSARATPPQVVDWNDCPDVERLEEIVDSIDYQRKELLVERDRLTKVILAKKKAGRPSLRVVGGVDA